jgi:hypothetical protein
MYCLCWLTGCTHLIKYELDHLEVKILEIVQFFMSNWSGFGLGSGSRMIF